MAYINNTIPAQALQRQCVKITVNLDTQKADFDSLFVGQKVISSTGTGYIDSIDKYGNSFKVKPNIDDTNQNFYFYDTNKGLFNLGGGVDTSV